MDSGANICAIRDKKQLGYFVDYPLPFKDVNGNLTFSVGYGVAFLRFPPHPYVYPIGPVYVSPNAPRNTLSLSALLQYCGFLRVTENMLRNCILTDFLGNTTKVPCRACNGLDFVKAEIITFSRKIHSSSPHILAMSSKAVSSSSQDSL